MNNLSEIRLHPCPEQRSLLYGCVQQPVNNDVYTSNNSRITVVHSDPDASPFPFSSKK